MVYVRNRRGNAKTNLLTDLILIHFNSCFYKVN
ncbi:hypothetical protein SAMN05421542_0200 [Chryseobacterium jejuense]|uniref:Uncharacterized protein n=1 Tax=Chryseobacterium jejuense TaxID=445960 RepID=A0A2X2X6Z9_CHRJE|nr:hypothetical protein SAMN05421542_0200 [Chryseobacterium jejuense]SQB46471.1 Uncharacterised protein [Chryseobacterium jejuense]